MQKSGHMVLKGVNWVHNNKISQMVLKEVTWLHNDKIRSTGVERGKLDTYCKNQVLWS